MHTLVRLLSAFLMVGALASCAHAATAAGQKSYTVPKDWPSDPKEKSADAFKRLTSSGKLGIAYLYTPSVATSDKDTVKKCDEMLTFVKKIVGDTATLDLLTSKFVVMGLKVADKGLAGRGSTVTPAGFVLFGTDGQKIAQVEAPMDSAASFRNLLLQSEALAAKARDAKAAEKAKEEEQRKKDAEVEKKKADQNSPGRIPGLSDEAKTKPHAGKSDEKKSGALQDE